MEILFEDDDIIAVFKPAGLASQATPDVRRPHIVRELLAFRPDGFPEGGPFLHHRLDVDTSGVLLLGKSRRANGPLTDLFRDHLMKKTYWCLCLRGPKSERLSAELRTLTQHLAPSRPSAAEKMQMEIVKSGGKKAVTEFRLLEALPNFDLIEARPHTGRTHQIRVQIASLSRPIAGDSMYGGRTSLVPRLMLHAACLEFTHPISGQAMRIEAPLPSDFRTILERERQA